jgi:1,4-dihydroxy-2-naphthoate octaprenyltransferase
VLKKFNLILVVHFLPVFFFVLAISPNINGDRVGLVLVAVFLLLIPSVNYIGANPERKISSAGDTKYSFQDFLSLVMVIVAIFLGWQISWQFNLLQGLYLFTVILISNQDKYLSVNVKWLVGRISQGLLLCAVVYVGLNQYGFNNLIRIHILLFSSLSTLIIITSLYISNLRDYYLLNEDDMKNRTRPIKIILMLIGLLLLAYSGFFTTTYHWRYAGYFTLAVLPAILISINLIRKIQSVKAVNLPVTLYWLNTILALGLVIFFIYFFIDSTQVLQAIRGGY